jgi:predicted Zn-dependent protease
MMAQFGGPSQDAEATALVQRRRREDRRRSEAAKSGLRVPLRPARRPNTINAFALPGGPVFITEALLARLQTEGQLAGVLGHEISHVVERHSAQQIAKQELTQGLSGALILSTYDPNDPGSGRTAQMALLIANLVNLKYGRGDELQADHYGVKLMGEAGYDPNAMVAVMDVLASSRQGGEPPEFFSTHPSPENRSERIKEAIQQYFPNGPPAGAIP